MERFYGFWSWVEKGRNFLHPKSCDHEWQKNNKVVTIHRTEVKVCLQCGSVCSADLPSKYLFAFEPKNTKKRRFSPYE